MKNLFKLTMISVLCCQTSMSQARSPASGMQKEQQSIAGGVGVTFIDGKPFYLINLMPELSFGKLGVGLDLNIRVGQDGKIRTEDFDEAYDYLRIIRYIRWGLKKDPVYFRIGTLDYARIGHGFILYMYRNSASYDLRRVGLEFDLDFEKFGFETVYGDVAGGSVLGTRGYVRPLKYTTLANAPILGNLEAGVTYAADFNLNANKTWGDATGTVQKAQDGGALSIFGVDIGLPIISLSILNSTLYADYAKIVNYGSGFATGIDLNFSGLGLVTLGGKLERRFLRDQFLPAYFGPLYERERYIPLDTTFISKAQVLKKAVAQSGYYGEVFINALGIIRIIGGYQSFDDLPNSGILHFELETGNTVPGVLLRGGYDKKNIGQVFTVDNNSVLYAQIGYKPLPYLIVSTLYEWTFTEEKDQSGRVVGYKTQRRIEPKIGFAFSF